LLGPELLEARNWVNVEVVEMHDILKDATITAEDFVPIALHDIVELHGAAMYVYLIGTTTYNLLIIEAVLYRRELIFVDRPLAPLRSCYRTEL
jgi:hypothetical protein